MKKLLLTASFIILVLFALSCKAAPSLKFKILGVSGELLESVTTQLQLKQEEITLYNEESISTFYREAPQEISKALELYGYFKSTVVVDKPSHKKDKWERTFRVNLGPPLKIVAIDLAILGAGSTNKIIQQHLRNFPLKKDDIFRTDEYNDAKQFLFNLADAHGYANAFLATKEVQIDLAANTATIVLHFDTGPQYYFGATSFAAPFFSKIFLRKFLPYKPGEIYSSKKLYVLQDALSNSNFFQKVEVTPQITENKLREIPVEVTLIPCKAKRYNLGVGFGTDTGVRGSLGVEMRRLTPTGHSFKGWAQGSLVQNNLELYYLIPGKHPITDSYNFNLTGKTLNIDKGKSLTGQAGVGYTTILKGWRQTIMLGLQLERYQLSGQPYESSILLIPSITWLHTKSDDPIRPTRGHSVNINIQGASEYLVATNSFFQSQVDAKYIKTLFTRMQLLLRATLGFTAINDINDLPLSLQFYTGGTQSIRGFGYNTIGPGRNLAVGSVELRHKIVGDWYLAAFFDAGNASNSLFTKPNQGVGGGVVWRTIIGVLELTYAKAISQPGSPGRIQFSFGAEL